MVLRAIVRVDGIPSEITVDRGLEKGLDQKAVDCLRQWRFSPALHDGDPVPGKVVVEINFRLPPAEKSK